jgi:hypothetical protein
MKKSSKQHGPTIQVKDLTRSVGYFTYVIKRYKGMRMHQVLPSLYIDGHYIYPGEAVFVIPPAKP